MIICDICSSKDEHYLKLPGTEYKLCRVCYDKWDAYFNNDKEVERLYRKQEQAEKVASLARYNYRQKEARLVARFLQTHMKQSVV